MRTPFGLVPQWVDERVTDGTAMRVYVRLARKYADADRHAFPRIPDLATELQLSDRTVKTALYTLRDIGAIVVTREIREDGYYGRNRYTLPLDPPRDVQHTAPPADQRQHDITAGRREGQPAARPDPSQEGQNTAPQKKPYPRSKTPSQNPSSSEVAAATPDPPPRPDVDQLCHLLHQQITANGSKAAIGQKWRDDARLLLDRDNRPLTEALDLIRWCQADPFWRTNILSMPTFRKQYDKLRLQYQTNGHSVSNGHVPYRNPAQDEYLETAR